MLTSIQAAADVTHDKTYLSCDVQAQRSVKDETGGSVTDPLKAYITQRVNILQADISTARKARRLECIAVYRCGPHADCCLQQALRACMRLNVSACRYFIQ